MIVETKKDFCLMVAELLKIEDAWSKEEIIGNPENLTQAVEGVLALVNNRIMSGYPKNRKALENFYNKYEKGFFKGRILELDAKEDKEVLVPLHETLEGTPKRGVVLQRFVDMNTDEYLTSMVSDGHVVGFAEDFVTFKHFEDGVKVNGQLYSLQGQSVTGLFTEDVVNVIVVKCRKVQ